MKILPQDARIFHGNSKPQLWVVCWHANVKPQTGWVFVSFNNKASWQQMYVHSIEGVAQDHTITIIDPGATKENDRKGVVLLRRRRGSLMLYDGRVDLTLQARVFEAIGNEKLLTPQDREKIQYVIRRRRLK